MKERDKQGKRGRGGDRVETIAQRRRGKRDTQNKR